MIDFAELRRRVQHAEGNNEVVLIHPLDLAEILMTGIEIEPVDIIKIKANNKEYLYIGETVYQQTVDAPRRLTAIQ